MIDRTKAAGLIPEPVANEIIDGVRKQSVAMQLMRRLPNMTSGTYDMPVLSMLPIADYVNGDAGMKVQTDAQWDKKRIVPGEIAAIVPVPDAVFDDSNFDIWSAVRPLLVEQMGRVFDRSVFAERNVKAPAGFPDPIIVAAKAAGNAIAVGTGADVAADVSATMAILEEHNYDITSIAAQPSLRAMLRNIRAADGTPIYQPTTSGTPSTIYGVPTEFVGAGVWDKAEALAVMGDWDKAVYSIRQDITFQVFDTGVITNDSGNVVYNLLQQDMKALRAVMRIGWQIANPIDIDRDDDAYPFAVLEPASGGGG